MLALNRRQLLSPEAPMSDKSQSPWCWGPALRVVLLFSGRGFNSGDCPFLMFLN